MFGGRYLNIVGFSLSGPGDFLALNIGSTLLMWDSVIHGL